MAASGATGGFVVTSGVFTKDAIEFASGRNVVLIDGAILFEMIKCSKRAPIGLTNPAIEKSSTTSSPSASSQVNCPICGSVMIQRTAKRGANAGSTFWGCSNYPACKGTRAMGK